MATTLIIFLFGILIGLIIADHLIFGTFGLWWRHKKEVENTPCPHGWVDWNDCPVCGH